MGSFKVLARNTVLDSPPWLRVDDCRIAYPNGQQVAGWHHIITPSFINVIARTREGLFLCQRIRKFAFEGESLAVVGGYIDGGEVPLAAAKRELLEETGYASEEWVSFGSQAVDANRGCGMAHLFFARNAYKIGEPTAQDAEAPRAILLTRQQLRDELFGDRVKCVTWLACAALALAYEARALAD
jgi:ADP-ribose pyrophosphatase